MDDKEENKFDRPFSKGLEKDKAAREAAGPDLMDSQNTTYNDIYDGPSEDLKDPIISEKMYFSRQKNSLEEEIRSLEQELEIKKEKVESLKEKVESLKKKIKEITETEMAKEKMDKAATEKILKIAKPSSFTLFGFRRKRGGKTRKNKNKSRKNKRKTGKNNRKSRRY
jgi:chromosome segregation ATPase